MAYQAIRSPIASFHDYIQALHCAGDALPLGRAFQRTHLSLGYRKRFLLALWLFDHPGFAAYAGGFAGLRFWTICSGHLQALPRGTMRRDFRGVQSWEILRALAHRYTNPERFVESLLEQETIGDLTGWLNTQPGFGAWALPWLGAGLDDVLVQALPWESGDFADFLPIREGLALLGTGDWRSPLTYADCRQIIKDLLIRLRYGRARVELRPFGIMRLLVKYTDAQRDRYQLGDERSALVDALSGWGAIAQTLQENLPCPSISAGLPSVAAMIRPISMSASPPANADWWKRWPH